MLSNPNIISPNVNLQPNININNNNNNNNHIDDNPTVNNDLNQRENIIYNNEPLSVSVNNSSPVNSKLTTSANAIEIFNNINNNINNSNNNNNNNSNNILSAITQFELQETSFNNPKEKNSIMEYIPQHFARDPFIMLNNQLCVSASEKKHLEIYYNYIKPPLLYFSTPFDKLVSKKSPGDLFQFSIAVATTSRSLGNIALSQNYERKARQIARDLFDDFSLSSAQGFAMLSYFYWGEDKLLSEHFREIAISICDGILENQTNDIFTSQEVIRTKLIALSNIDAVPNSPTFIDLFRKEQQNRSLSSIEESALQKLTFAFKILDYCDISTFPCVKANAIDEESAKRFLNLVAAPGQRCRVYSTNNVLSSVGVYAYLGVVFYCSGQFERSLNFCIAAIDACNNSDQFLFASPFFILVFHFLFSLSCQLGKYDLAAKVNRLQATIANIFKRGKYFHEIDSNILSTLVNFSENNGGMMAYDPNNIDTKFDFSKSLFIQNSLNNNNNSENGFNQPPLKKQFLGSLNQMYSDFFQHNHQN